MKKNNLENDINIKISNISKDEIFSLFSGTETYHGILINLENKNIINQSILFKIIFIDNYLYFLLYDYQNMYFSKQSKEEINELNTKYNPTILHKNFDALIEFITNNFIIENENLIINSKIIEDKIEFEFSSKLEILWVKYSFLSECLNKDFLIELSQNLFIKPINNFILSIQNLISLPNDIIENKTFNAISYSDIKNLVKNSYINKNKGFNNVLSKLIKDSSIAVNNLTEKINPIIDTKKNIILFDKNISSKKNTKQNKNLKMRKGEKIYNIEDEQSNDKNEKSKEKDNISIKEETNIIKEKEVKKSKKKKMKFI